MPAPLALAAASAVTAGAGITIGGALTAATLAYGVFGAINAGHNAQHIADFNASIAKSNADLTAQRAEIEKINTRILERQTRERGMELIAKRRIGFGKAGVETNSGTALVTLADTAGDVELDAIRIAYAGSQKNAELAAREAGFRQDAETAKLAGREAKTRAYGQAGKSLLTGLDRFINA